MFDIIYLTWFVHLSTALLTPWFWAAYLLIPTYATWLLYRKLAVPFLLGGRDPLGSMLAALTGGGGASGRASVASSFLFSMDFPGSRKCCITWYFAVVAL